MYIGRYSSNYTAFVTHTGTYWDPVSKTTKTGSATGSTAAEARRNFCTKYGPVCSNGKKGCYGDPGCPTGNVSGSGNTNWDKLASVKTADGKARPIAVARQENGRTVISNKGTPAPDDDDGCSPRPCPPPSNKTDIIGYWNQAACHFGNLTCHKLPDWGFTVVAGLGGVLLLVLLTKRRR